MIIKAANVIGKKIVTIQGGKEIGNVKDIIYEPQANKVRAFLIDEAGWFSDAKVIPIENVTSIGKDALMVEIEDAIKRASEVPKPIANIAREGQYLTKTRIVTEKGIELGRVSDIYFESQTGDLVEFEISKGPLADIKSGKRRIRVSDILTIGEDATIVRDSTEKMLEEQAKTTGIQGAAYKSEQKASQIINRAKSSIEELGTEIQEKIKKYRKKGPAYVGTKGGKKKIQNQK